MSPYPAHHRCLHIAGIAWKGAIYALGWNHNKTHSLATKFAKNEWAIYLHAEIDVIKNFLKSHSTHNMPDATLYIYSQRHDGSIRNSRPCEGCQRAIDAFDIKRVVYSTPEGYNEITRRNKPLSSTR